ncbi:cytochrome c-type biogenesis protein [Natrinema hispanicum]|uniref:Cytochrome c-type biogenesis protein n=1 Tax=Natrinema hispanicum TaxID=392421 RepID=A0A482YDV0_9EURY|nr:cytochrome c-type biogenesis protein [Natrinema hispanicum]
MVDAALTTSIVFGLSTGIATFFSPCAYPLLPGYVGFYVSQTDGEQASLGGALSRGLFAGLGVLVTFTTLLGATFWVGQSTLSSIKWFEAVCRPRVARPRCLDRRRPRAVVFGYPPESVRSSVFGFSIFGVGYALASAGCVAPLFISVVTRALSLSMADAVVLLGTYVGSVVVLMVSLTVATGMGLVAGAGRLTAYSGLLKRIAGVVMIVAGIGQLYLAVVRFNIFGLF